MIHYSQCPVCRGEAIQEVISAKDHTVSQETFSIWECQSCTLRFTQNVPDANAIGPYYKAEAYISHTDTKEGIINKLYHRIRKITLKSKSSLVKRHTRIKQGSILDIGSGTGAFLHTMQSEGWDVSGLEPDTEAANKSESLYGIKPQQPDQLFQLPSSSYHAITMWHVLEHVHELQSYVDQLKRLLRENGVIFIAVPNYTSGDAQHYQSSWAAYDVPRHLYHFSPKSLEVLMQQHGLRIVQMKQMWFDSFYVSMLSEQYRKGKSNIIAAFFNGLISNFKAIGKPQRCSSVIYVITTASSTAKV